MKTNIHGGIRPEIGQRGDAIEGQENVSVRYSILPVLNYRDIEMNCDIH